MTSGRGPLASRLSIATRACHSELSSISMFHSATGSTVPSPEPVPVARDPPVAASHSTLRPPPSEYSVTCCTPAPSVAVKVTSIQFCQPPLPGTQTCCQTLLGPLNPTCRLAPLGE